MTIAPETFTIDGVGGTRIVADRLGDPQAPAVVFLHGGGQTRRSWGKAAAAVAERGWQAVTVDLRGHGESDWSERRRLSRGQLRRRRPRSAATATAATGAGRRIPGWVHVNASCRRDFARHRQRGCSGGHRAEHGSVWGDTDSRLHGRPDEIGIRVTRRGRRHDRRVQPATAPTDRSRWPAHQPAPPR